MSRVSVLVAVYNAACYLQECLDSLTGQTLRDIEIICVDDCSTDNSLDILNGYASRDSRIRVIRLVENGGQAHARNVGLGFASGDFVCMLDADDHFSSDALECAVNVFDRHSSTGCVLFDVVMEYADRAERYQMPDFEVLTGGEALRLSLTWRIHGLYMVRADIHRRHPYDETCRLYSDDNTTRIHYIASGSVRRCDGIYYYRQHEMSATHSVSVRRFDYLRANESMLRQMKDMDVAQDAVAEYNDHRWLNMIDTYMFYHCHGAGLTVEERQYGLEELHRVWLTMADMMRGRSVASKFGYRPMPSWPMFRVQEWLYFSLRGLLGRNK